NARWRCALPAVRVKTHMLSMEHTRGVGKSRWLRHAQAQNQLIVVVGAVPLLVVSTPTGLVSDRRDCPRIGCALLALPSPRACATDETKTDKITGQQHSFMVGFILKG